MRALFDACVLYPTVLRQILIGVCDAGLAEPLWSQRILGEWEWAAARLGPGQEHVARAEILELSIARPAALVDPGPVQAPRLPDPHDRHVLAAAIAGKADVLVTLNVRDFPRRAMTEAGVERMHPDKWLIGLFDGQPDVVASVAESVRRQAERLSGAPQPIRPLMKRARLPQLGKRLG